MIKSSTTKQCKLKIKTKQLNSKIKNIYVAFYALFWHFYLKEAIVGNFNWSSQSHLNHIDKYIPKASLPAFFTKIPTI